MNFAYFISNDFAIMTVLSFRFSVHRSSGNNIQIILFLEFHHTCKLRMQVHWFKKWTRRISNSISRVEGCSYIDVNVRLKHLKYVNSNFIHESLPLYSCTNKMEKWIRANPVIFKIVMFISGPISNWKNLNVSTSCSHTQIFHRILLLRKLC